MERHVQAPMSRETAAGLQAGDYVYITGTIYTARDAAHKRMQETLEQGMELPLAMQRLSYSASVQYSLTAVSYRSFPSESITTITGKFSTSSLRIASVPRSS